MTIRTYYRPDNTMLRMLALYGMSIKHIDGHHCVIRCHDNDLTRHFVKNNKDGCEIVEMEVLPFPKYYVIDVGVSLSQFTVREFTALNNSKLSTAFQFANLDVRPWNDNKSLREILDATAVDGLYIAPSKTAYMWHDGTTAEKYTDTEMKFIKLLDGFDFWYSYSDDASVYRAWNNKWKNICSEGEKLGLSDSRMNSIFKDLSNQ